jgi:methionine-rich copper-binding protein CopC
MTMKKLLIAGFIGMLATSAMAHSPLQRTTPQNNAIVADMPAEVTLGFKGKIRLTRLKMTHMDQPSVDLDLTGHTGFIAEYAVPMQPMGKGSYLIEWRGLGADGHALTGTFSFTVE